MNQQNVKAKKYQMQKNTKTETESKLTITTIISLI